jgi:carboxypeptidase family protein
MNRVVIILALAALALGLGPQQSPARDGGKAVTVPAGTASISGIVVDETNRPVRRATVSVSGDMRLERSTVTDDAGRFTVGRLPKGRFTVTATKSGCPEMSYGASRPYRTGSGLLLADSQQVTDIVLKLSHGAVITGTVFDDHGQPMPGVPVMAYEVRTSLSGERTFDNGRTVAASFATDDQGVYRVFGLPPGEYTVGTAWFFGSRGGIRVPTDAEIKAVFEAGVPPAGRGSAGPAEPPPVFNYAPVFFPGSVDPLTASTVVLTPGEIRDGVDVRMQFRRAVTLQGHVTGPNGPAKNVRVVLDRHTQVAAMQVTSFYGAEADGNFGAPNLIPASYDLVASAPATADQPELWAEANFSVTGAETAPIQISLTLQPAMTMTGSVVFAGTGQLAPPDFARVNVFIDPDEGMARTNSIATTPIDASGHFSITGIRPGRYRLVGNTGAAPPAGQPGWRVLSVLADGYDVTDLPIEVSNGAAPALTVTFTDQAAELAGTLSSPTGQPATDYFVVLLPADPRYWSPISRRILSTRPDATGHYVFRGLPAGEYHLAVTTDLVQGDLQDRATLQRLSDQSQPVTLRLGQTATFDVKIGGLWPDRRVP